MTTLEQKLHFATSHILRGGDVAEIVADIAHESNIDAELTDFLLAVVGHIDELNDEVETLRIELCENGEENGMEVAL